MGHRKGDGPRPEGAGRLWGGHACGGSVDTGPALTASSPPPRGLCSGHLLAAVRQNNEDQEEKGQGPRAGEESGPRQEAQEREGRVVSKGLTRKPTALQHGRRGRAPCTHPLSVFPSLRRSPDRDWQGTDAQATDGTQVSPPGVGGTAHRGQMVFVAGREAGEVQNRLSTPQQTAWSRAPAPGQEDTLALGFIKQVYSHFRKTNSRTGNGLPAGWAGDQHRKAGGRSREGRHGGWGP